MIKSFCLCSVLIITTLCISADDDTYLKKSLRKIEKIDQQSMTVLQKAMALDDLENALMTHLKCDIDARTYYSNLRDTSKRIEGILAYSQDLYKFLHPQRTSDKRPYLLDGEWTSIYYNNHDYHQGRTLSAEEIEQFYQLEKRNYESNKLIVTTEKFDVNSLKKIESGITYNFIVTPEKELIFTPESITTYDIRNNKQFVGLNHAVISGNKPLLTAGVFILYKNKDKILFFISNATGHYKTDFESLNHVKKLMILQGIPEEAIVLTCLSTRTFSKMPWRIIEKLQAKK